MKAWILNLDADLELAGPSGYAPTKSVLAAMRPHVETLARTLLAPGDVLHDHPAARGRIGRAFCPTPRAIAALSSAGALLEPHPSVEVLRRVNSRAFCAELGQTLPEATFVRDLATAREILARPPQSSDAWLVKRAFGMAGRGQRVVRVCSETDLAFVRAAIADGVQIEPQLTIDREYGLHGVLAADGTFVLGALVRQRCDARGAWLASERAPIREKDELDVAERLADAARLVARALHGAGYFGPFGIDAFVYLHRGERLLQPRSEINARYSMGFGCGFDG